MKSRSFYNMKGNKQNCTAMVFHRSSAYLLFSKWSRTGLKKVLKKG
uniref:Uncharacterized protein n=1 Tax=Arundo donax TaxID=35708 RepID=A0A0A9B3N2_ARUDO